MSSSRHSFSSSEDNFSNDDRTLPCLKGVLSKWTNYYHGWQDRYVSCEDGSLLYYRARDEIGLGCRGSISLVKAVVKPDQFDPCRFDVTIKDNTWYLRSSSEAERRQWIEVIEANMIERDTISIQSETASHTPEMENEFKTKLSELITLRSILRNQIDVLQKYFDACLSFSNKNGFKNCNKNDAGTSVDPDRDAFFEDIGDDSKEISKVDLKREALSFKVTTDRIELAMSDLLSLANEREMMWKRKYEELEKRLSISTSQHQNLPETIFKANTSVDDVIMTSSDDESDDEFYDPNNNFDFDKSQRKIRHRFANEVESKIKEHLEDSFRISGTEDDKWELIAQDEEMRLFRTELIRDGVVCDPMKAVHRATGVTGRELCHYFWETSCRQEWDHTIEELNILEVVDDVTVIIHQVHKQVWPVTQRDCLYISTILKVEEPPTKQDGAEPVDTWMVCNFSVDHDKAVESPDRVRALVEVALVCQTFVNKSENPDLPISRDDLSCDIVYIANVNPGGWAPASILRAIGKREYPKFLRNFTNFVEEKMRSSDILF